MIVDIKIDLEFQTYIPHPPKSPTQLMAQAASNDEITVKTWKDTWINQTKENHRLYGPFKKNHLGKCFNRHTLKPCIVVGSGPSLKKNIDCLKDTKGIPIISCLHNYHFLEDRGITPDFYVNLDSGHVTIDEICEGGTKTSEEYLESTKDKKLCAFIGSHPDLISKWKGEVVWFNAPIPSKEITQAIWNVEPFDMMVSSGGNVLGACFYIAKAICGANPIIFVGADFSFSYDNKFHGWESKYDKDLGHVIKATDVFGNRVKTWDSYYNFKCWFESRICSIPGLYINSTEGGIFGSYHNGNIQQLQQIALADVISMYDLTHHMRGQCEDPSVDNKLVLF